MDCPRMMMDPHPGFHSSALLLKQALQDEIEHIHLRDNNAVARKAALRLQEVAEHAPAFILLLAEPWLVNGMDSMTEALLLDCARIHLYARVLDDAIDEGQPIHRQNLLRAQPMYWRAVQRIGSHLNCEMAKQAEQLIAQTVTAVLQDDLEPDPANWGAKNHHLLLIPLLISGNSSAYQDCQPALSNLIALVQAGDEWKQGEFESLLLRSRMLDFLDECLASHHLENLKQSGWHRAAERLLWNASQLITVLSKQSRQ